MAIELFENVLRGVSSMRVACNKAGGPAECPYVAEAGSMEELVTTLTQHGMSHPDVKEMMENMTEAEKAQWMETLKSQVEH